MVDNGQPGFAAGGCGSGPTSWRSRGRTASEGEPRLRILTRVLVAAVRGCLLLLCVGGVTLLRAGDASTPPVPPVPPAPAPIAPEALFDQAAKLYEGGRANEAAAVYDRLLTNGIVTPAVLFNQGNAWFRAGKIGRSIVSYRRALGLAPRDSDVTANLQRARAKVGAGAAPVEGVGARVLRWLAPNEWAVLALAAVWVWLGVLILGRVFQRLKPAAAALAWPLAVGAGLAVGVAGAASRLAGHPAAVVVAPDTSVRFGPLEESQVAFTLPDGAELVVTDRKGDWLGVRDGAGRRGWIAARNVATLP